MELPVKDGLVIYPRRILLHSSKPFEQIIIPIGVVLPSGQVHTTTALWDTGTNGGAVTQSLIRDVPLPFLYNGTLIDMGNINPLGSFYKTKLIIPFGEPITFNLEAAGVIDDPYGKYEVAVGMAIITNFTFSIIATNDGYIFDLSYNDEQLVLMKERDHQNSPPI